MSSSMQWKHHSDNSGVLTYVRIHTEGTRCWLIINIGVFPFNLTWVHLTEGWQHHTLFYYSTFLKIWQSFNNVYYMFTDKDFVLVQYQAITSNKSNNYWTLTNFTKRVFNIQEISLRRWHFLEQQSSAIIMESNLSWYYLRHCNDSSRT